MYTATEIKDGLTPAQREQLHAAHRRTSSRRRTSGSIASSRCMLAYAGQPRPSPKILAAMPKGNENQELQLHYLYALRTIKQGWTAEQKTQLAEVLGPHIAMARRRAVHQLRRTVSSIRSPTLRDRRREAAALREGAGLLAAHARASSPRSRRARRQPARQAVAAGRRTRARPGGPARRADRRPRAQPPGDVRGNGVSSRSRVSTSTPAGRRSRPTARRATSSARLAPTTASPA